MHTAKTRQRTEPGPRRIAWRTVGLLLAWMTIGPGVSTAQYSSLEDLPPDFEWRGRIRTDFRNEFKTKSDGGDEFDAWGLGASAEFGGPINESILIGFRTGYRHTSYDFNLGPAAPADFGGTALPRDPWNSVNTLDFLPNVTFLVGSKVSVVVATPIRWAGESGSDRNGFSAGVSALARWQVTESLMIGAGIGITSQLEDSAETFPLIALHWRITESLEIQTEGSWLQGGSAVLLWGASESIRLTLSAGYERTRFRLDDNGHARDRNGIGEVTAVPIEVGLRLQFIERAIFDVRAGLAVDGRLRVESRTGNKLYDQQYDPAPRVGVSLTIPLNLPARRSSRTATP
jgi:hypothetical protein